MTIVTLSHIQKKFMSDDGEAFIALNDVSLKSTDGEVIVILGPSGCGKSTLLRVIAGLVAPDSGSVLYDNVPLSDVPAMERGVGMVFQDGALMPHWISEKSVGFFLSLRKRENEIPERVRRIAEITGIGLEKLLERKPSQLSGGERQRVGIARALARDPRLFLFDEPFSSIDAALRTQARFELKRLLREFPVTSFYVTHDQSEARTMAHRVVVMRAGKIEQVGSYATLHDNPINLFVATFVGTPTINLFGGQVQNHRWVGKTFSGYPVRGDLDDDTKVVMALRPEHFTVTAEATTHPAVVAARITEIEAHFAERIQIAQVVTDYDQWTLVLPLEMRSAVGEVVYCAPNPDAMLYFDPKSGQRIG